MIKNIHESVNDFLESSVNWRRRDGRIEGSLGRRYIYRVGINRTESRPLLAGADTLQATDGALEKIGNRFVTVRID